VTDLDFDHRVLANDPGRRGSLMKVFGSALAAVDPEVAVEAALVREGVFLTLNERRLDLTQFDRCVVLAFGKASVPMARGIASVVVGLPVDGVVVSNTPEAIDGLEVLRSSHPVPDSLSVAAARRLVESASTAEPDDLVIVGISGGGSALLTLPAAGITLEDLATTTGALLKCGATIDELNVIRRHLSAVKGGRLAEIVAGAGAVLSLVISDVVGDDLSVIASGPMVPDPSTFSDAMAVLDEYSIHGEVPAAVVEHLIAGVAGEIDDTPDGGTVFDRQSISLVATAADAAIGAAQRARQLGWEPTVVTTTLTGEAREVAARVAAESRDMSAGQILIYAGETTVTVVGDGSGGRNQELALAASIELAGDDGVVLLSGGTDGIDGMSDAAGGLVDGHTEHRGRALGLDSAAYLARNDSNTYLASVGDVIVTGPTGTNVGDVLLVARSG
jgi:hydroxypyruvate reductase